MKSKKSATRFRNILGYFLVICLLTFPLNTVFADTTSDKTEFNPENLTAGLKQTNKKIVQTDESTGALSYNYQITIPPGRNGLEPSLNLNYNNQQINNIDNIFGYGWNISIPFIERINKTGTDKLYTENNNYFYSSLSGELSLVSGTNYTSKIEEGEFLKYTFSNNSWTAIDKKGTSYKFGLSTNGRQDDQTGTKIYKWMLEEIRDTNNNYVKYEYFKDSGQIYPSKIKYTGNGSTDGIFEVEFIREDKIDTNTSYATGFFVKTNFRIKEIQTKINNNWVRKYNLSYTIGDNGVRSLLQSITESGQDENSTITTLPATSFEYHKMQKTDAWIRDDINWKTNNVDFSEGVLISDINGDNLADILQSFRYYDDGAVYYKIGAYINNGLGWTNDVNWLPPSGVYFLSKSEREVDTIFGYNLLDVNGDKLSDLVGNTGSYLNTGSGWSALNTEWSLPIYTHFSGMDTGVRFAEVNGDDLIDIIYGWNSRYSGTFEQKVFINNGSGWDLITENWQVPVDLTEGTFIGDVNGDGLSDIVQYFNQFVPGPDGFNNDYKGVYINTGNNWELINQWVPSSRIAWQNLENSSKPIIRESGRLIDVNSDGLPDLTKNSQINTGIGWGEVSSQPSAPFNRGSNSITPYPDRGIRLADLNGDGLMDLIQSWRDRFSPGFENYAIVSNDRPSDYLIKITIPTGAVITMSYKSSTEYKNNNTFNNPDLPFPVQVVDYVSTTDPSGIVSTDTYSYEGGKYYFGNILDKKFVGFSKVTKTNSVGDKTINYYHQGDSSNSSMGEYADSPEKSGKIYRTENYDGQNRLFSKTINKWDKVSFGPNRSYIKLSNTITFDYDGNNTHKDKASEFTYDNYGNIIEQINYGEVLANNDGTFTDAGEDKQIENILYVSNFEKNIISLPYKNTITDQSFLKVKEQRRFYDNLPLGSVQVGNNTKIQDWVSGTTYINNLKQYNTQYGLVISSTDPKGNITQFSLDQYYLYPSLTTDPLGQQISYLYDYSLGKPKQITDKNNFVYQYNFDPLDRILEEKIPDIISPYSPVPKTSYLYTDTRGSVSIKKTEHLDNTNSFDTYQYFDGLGRLIQERTEAESDNTFSVRDLIYGNTGLLIKESIPYFANGFEKTNPTTNQALYNTYTYDPKQRVISVSNTLGNTIYKYDNWKTTITDANKNTKKYYKNAYDNLIKVDEINNGDVYSTYYKWDLNNNLINITDSQNNTRNFKYDGLGRKVLSEDLHKIGDSTFGTWKYKYDNSGNLTNVLDPKLQSINYTYDKLNRLKTEDYTGEIGKEVVYTYDTCAGGIGKLCKVSMLKGADTKYTYNSNGGVSKEIKTIEGKNYQTSYLFDRQNNLTTLTYPDSSKVLYTYNTAGLLEKVEQKENTSALTSIISNLNYNPNKNIITKNFSNGVTTQNKYDESKLYRLSRILTKDSSLKKIQDLNYTYDKVGNIITTKDTSKTNTTKIANYQYDDLYRLTTANITGTPSSTNPYIENYTYNSLGNIISGPLGFYIYEGEKGTNYANPHASTSINGNNLEYDNNGNLINDSLNSYTYDYNNRLIENSRPDALNLSYLYDHSGNRVKYSTNSTTTHYPNKYYNQEGTVKTKQIYALDSLVATIEKTTNDTTTYFNHTDNLNSIILVTDKDGTIVKTLDYYPFGNQRLNEGEKTAQRQFIGQIYDTESELNYLNARYYNSKNGQFLSQDPVHLSIGFSSLEQITNKKLGDLLTDPQILNSYSYARNNPIILTDGSGKFIDIPVISNNRWVQNFATNSYNTDSTWKFAMDHPHITAGIVGLSAIPGFIASGAVATELTLATFSGVSATYAAQHAAAAALYSAFIIKDFHDIPDIIDKFDSVDPNNSASIIPGIYSLTMNVGLSIIGGDVYKNSLLKDVQFSDYKAGLSLAYKTGTMLGKGILNLFGGSNSDNTEEQSNSNSSTKVEIKK